MTIKPYKPIKVARAELDTLHKREKDKLAKIKAHEEIERTYAKANAMEMLAELGSTGLKLTQYEVVRPLGRIAAGLEKVRLSREGDVIRANTHRLFGREYVIQSRHALITPRQGYVLPQLQGCDPDRSRTVLFPDGTTGTTMTWGPTHASITTSVGRSDYLPPETYHEDLGGYYVFYPLYPIDDFRQRNCTPVWGGSLQSLNTRSSTSLTELADRIALINATE